MGAGLRTRCSAPQGLCCLRVHRRARNTRCPGPLVDWTHGTEPEQAFNSGGSLPAEEPSASSHVRRVGSERSAGGPPLMEDWIAKEGYPGLGGDAYVERLDAVNFAIYSKHATAVRLNLYRRDSVVEPFFTYDFDPISNKTGRIWHCILPGATVRDGAYYSYTIDGPSAPAQGLRFDREKVLLAPYAKGVFFPPELDRDAARGPGPNSGRSPLGVLCCTRQEYQWGGDQRPRMHGHDLVIYETHVRQFTAHPSSGVSADRRGTYSGLVDKIPYLNDLGVTAV